MLPGMFIFKNENSIIFNCFFFVNFIIRREIFAHFTQVVRDEAYKIGCAISRFSDPINKKPLSLITCNYAVTNLATFPVYEEGDAASGCKTGPHPNYPGLCSESEVYDGQFFHPMSEELKSTFDAVSEDCPLNKH